MSKVVATTVLPEDSGEVLTFGDASDAIVISGDSLNVNTIQDAGGNNIFTSDGAGNLTVPSVFGGAMNLLTTNTFTGASSSSFTTLIDSTYDVYCFKFNAINPATTDTHFQFNFSTDGGSNYNMIKTTTFFRAYLYEDNSSSGLGYKTDRDLAQSTDYQILLYSMGNGSDENAAGELYLFNPSGTTYVKHFYARSNGIAYTQMTLNSYVGGYVNSTDNVDAIDFKFSSGNMDGEIKMYGISKS